MRHATKLWWSVLLLGVGGCAATNAQQNTANTSTAITALQPEINIDTVRPERLVARPQRFVSADMGNLTVNPDWAFLQMGALVRAYPKTPRLRVSWDSSGFGRGFRSTALYDRKKKTLRTFSSGHGYEGLTFRSSLYTRVTDAMILRAARANSQHSRPDFETLPELGAILERRQTNEIWNAPRPQR